MTVPENDLDLRNRNGQETRLKAVAVRLSLFDIRRIKDLGGGSFTTGIITLINAFFKGPK